MCLPLGEVRIKPGRVVSPKAWVGQQDEAQTMSCCCFRAVSALLVRRNHVGAERDIGFVGQVSDVDFSCC